MDKKIGLLGGTFDPIHNGHILMAVQVSNEYHLDSCLFLPAFIPPHKRERNISSFEHRTDMCEIALSAHSNFSVSGIEKELGGVSYTYLTLSALKRELKGELYYIIGGDSLFELHLWRNPEEIARLAKIICVPRPGTEGHLTRAGELKKEYNLEVLISSREGKNISSTAVREIIQSGGDASGLLPEGVFEYVRQHRLYQ